jgi:hypothetical protein
MKPGARRIWQRIRAPAYISSDSGEEEGDGMDISESGENSNNGMDVEEGGGDENTDSGSCHGSVTEGAESEAEADGDGDAIEILTSSEDGVQTDSDDGLLAKVMEVSIYIFIFHTKKECF